MKQSLLVTKTRKVISSQETSINAQLLERAGYIAKLMAGVYTYLPLGLRVLSRIESIVREAMNSLEAQEILMPALQPKDPWEVTGRWDKVDILYKIKVGDRDLCLGPTHEEIVTPLIGGYIHSYKDLPRAVYQIQTKFRNEARPKSGLLRGREFRMKDLYSFHTSEADLHEYYEKVREVYMTIFKRCGLGDITYYTYASGGMFTKYSHEFQTVAPLGEDTIFVCESCLIAVNQEIRADQPVCPNCSSSELVERTSIEVGNIFALLSRFTEPFNVEYSNQENTQQSVLMGCYGLGTSRLMGAIVEVLHDEKGIVWPVEIAPFSIHLISLSRKPETQIRAQELYDLLVNGGFEVLFDERIDCSAGEKFADADLMGIPFRLVFSEKTAAVDSVEFKGRTQSESSLIILSSLVEFLRNQIVAQK
ncbi:prolyl-tRNA synthetase [Candidatus Dependentiae bacterium]|nr:prolyl-tRNA synthetase [Candidatus Dependentiae bacterium]